MGEFTPKRNREGLGQDGIPLDPTTDDFHIPTYADKVDADAREEHGGDIGPVGGVITRSPDADPTPQTAEDDPNRHPGMGPGSR